MNPAEMVVLIVSIVMISSVFRARYQHRSVRRALEVDPDDPREAVDNARLRDEVQALKQRIQVLERITVEKENSLTREIEQLRDR